MKHKQGSRLGKDEITRLKDTNSKKLFEEKKLQLVLDLDNTLIHSKKILELTPEEKYLKKQTCCSEDESNNGSLFRLKSGKLVKLRPFVRTFLQEASPMFEMYIYTNGNRSYAKHVAELLDSEGKYFGDRIISRDDCIQEGMKTLDLVLGQECGIIILDDMECVWSEDHRKNLVLMKDYTYFSKVSKHKSYSEKKKDESESNGVLAYILTVVKAIHSLFFSPKIASLPCNDVRMLLALLRSKILMGCVIFFSNVDDQLHQGYPNYPVKAKELGAEVTERIDSTVTHVVSSKKKNVMEVFVWGNEQKIFMVNPRWIATTYFLWHRQPEENFSSLN